ncbi:transposase [Rhodohalobacter sp. 8-1]|uniref:transposase n=1 Tax=Rhodohalobacter sp. 8-1 TaxID=3131972 RepID=UPI0030EDDE37
MAEFVKIWSVIPFRLKDIKITFIFLCLLLRKIAQMTLIQQVKRGSSKWVKTIDPRYADFYWQDGYGIFSVSPNHVDTVIEYTINQHKHHQRVSFKDEYRKILNQYGIDFDERDMCGTDISGLRPRWGCGMGLFACHRHHALHNAIDRRSVGAALC